MLEDSPIMTGQYFQEYALAPEVTPKHYIDLFGDAPEDVQLRPKVLAGLSNLVREGGAMYSSHHYTSYHFLLTLTKHRRRRRPRAPRILRQRHRPRKPSPTTRTLAVDIPASAHEFTHSWNGKYRRPAGLATPDYATPMQGQLLWVYEGLTDYLGNVLGARSGFTPPATTASTSPSPPPNSTTNPAAHWRSTEDTAISVSVLRGAARLGQLARGTDYYQEGDLLWLDVDTTIRKLTNNKKSLHDFLVLFVGKGGSTAPMVVPYDRAELDRRPQPGRPLRLGRLPPRPHRQRQSPRRPRRHRAGRLQARLHRQAQPPTKST